MPTRSHWKPAPTAEVVPLVSLLERVFGCCSLFCFVFFLAATDAIFFAGVSPLLPLRAPPPRFTFIAPIVIVKRKGNGRGTTNNNNNSNNNSNNSSSNNNETDRRRGISIKENAIATTAQDVRPRLKNKLTP